MTATAQPPLLVVLTHNDLDETRRCVAAWRALGWDARDTLLIDNGSTPSTLEALENLWPGATCERLEPNHGLAGGRNHAFHAARTGQRDRILYFDNDAVPQAGMVEALDDALQSHPDVACAGVVFRRLDAPSAPLLIRRPNWRAQVMRPMPELRRHFGLETPEVPAGPPRAVDFLFGGGLLARVAALEDVGGFDPGFHPYGSEDIDLGLRLQARGWRLLEVPAARALHPPRPDGSAPNTLRVEANTRHTLRLARRHLDTPGLLRELPSHLGVYLPLKVARHLARGELDAARAVLRAVRWHARDIARNGWKVD